MATREQYYAMIHLGAKRLGLVDDADRRAWLENLTGKRRCKDCTVDELSSVTSTLRACKALDNPKLKGVKGGQGEGDRPTDAQWNMANTLCRKLGMSGCGDARFAAFVKRNAHVDHPRFLTKFNMRQLIAGLQRWLENAEKREGQK